MATAKTKTAPLSKKEMKKRTAEKIEISLVELKDQLGEKKFQKRVRKAAKLLTSGLSGKGKGKKKTA